MSTTEKFEHYEVLKHEDGSLFELGRGAMGITYKALDTDLECFVALKIINPSTIANKDAEQRFFREARSAAQLRHPNIASVFRLGKTDDGTHYYAMEFCEGQTLQQMIEQSGPIECQRALHFTLQVTKALIVAEERHLVHRDLKPSNLIVTQRSDEGEVIKVIDFGLAKSTTPEGTMWSSMGTHGFIGTAHFASPEQIEDKPVDTRSDIYSLGSTLWFMLMGKPPFEGSLARIMSQHLTSMPDFSVLHGVPEKVVALIRRMMEKNAEDRPQSALELRREIMDCMEMPCMDSVGPNADAGQHQAVAPVAEPPPLPVFAPPAPTTSAPPPEEAWTPSLLELLRVRSVLPPSEAFLIGDALAAKLDQDPESEDGPIRVQDITIHFNDSPNAEQTRARLHEHPAVWPAFDLRINPGEDAAAMTMLDPSLMTTIVPGEEVAGDRAQQLARLIYELLGGVAGSRYVPVARLGETGNAVLQRATIVGLAGYPTLRDLMEKLREASLLGPATAPDPIRAAAPLSTESKIGLQSAPSIPPKDESMAQVQSKPPAPIQPKVSTPVEPLRHVSPEPPPLPRQSPPALAPSPKKPGLSPGVKIALKVLAGAAGLFMIIDGIKTIHSGASSSHSQTQADLAPPAQADPPSTQTPSAPPPTVTPAASQVQFTIFDDLGPGQISESVQVFVDGQNAPAGTISLSPPYPRGSAVINLSSAGRHSFSVQTESVVIDLNKGSKTIKAAGQWEIDFRGGEKYDLSATPQENGDSYQLDVKPRNY